MNVVIYIYIYIYEYILFKHALRLTGIGILEILKIGKVDNPPEKRNVIFFSYKEVQFIQSPLQ